MNTETKTSKISLKERVGINDNVLFEDVDGAFVLMDLRNGIYFSLNETGNFIWEILKKEKAIQVQQIVNRVCEEYEIEKMDCIVKTTEFLNLLKERDLLNIV